MPQGILTLCRGVSSLDPVSRRCLGPAAVVSAGCVCVCLPYTLGTSIPLCVYWLLPGRCEKTDPGAKGQMKEGKLKTALHLTTYCHNR